VDSKLLNLPNAEPLNVSKLAVSINKLAVAEFKLVIEVACVPFVDNAVDADASNAVNLVFCVPLVVSFEPVYVFRLLTEIFTLPDVVSKLFNLPTLAV
jgi:hypothetical protein